METNLAVLIDFENIAAGTEKEGLGRFDVEALMQRVKDKGRILVARSYADWGRFSRFKQALLTSNVTMMELTSHGMQDKNRADIAMVVDALELAFTKDYIDTYVIVSGDSDFTPMVLKMRELNKRVIGCGTRKSTSRLLIQACDEFFFYDTIAKPKKTRTSRVRQKAAETGVMSLETAFDLLEEAIEGLQREDPDPPLASIVKTAVLRKSPDFSETDLGFGSFARFLEAAQDSGVVKVVRDRKSGGYRVDALDDSAPAEAEAAPAAPSTTFSDPYMPPGADRFIDPLVEAGFDPLAASTRKAVLEALEEAVGERRKRRRKVTVQFIAEDVRKALRRTHPELPLATIRSILEALMQSGQLIHRDGTTIRSANASFKLEKDAEQLNKALTSFYLANLIDASVDLSDTSTLSQLFLGSSDRQREIEETVAWLQTHGEAREEAELNEVDLDDLLVMDAEPAKAPAAKAPAAKAPAAEKAAVAEKAPAAKAAPAKKAAPRKAAPKKAAAVDEDEAEASASDEAEEEPKKKAPRKRSRGRKKEDTDNSLSADDDDDLLKSDLDALLQPSK